MPITHGTVGAQQVSVDAKITRADGTVVDLGTVAYWHRNPLRRLLWRLSRLFHR